jgi:hypothetical protein
MVYMDFQDNKYSFKRYDLADDKSLKAWSAADEYLLETFDALEGKSSHLGIYNDRFGFLACYLHSVTPTMIITNKSQEKTIDRNLKANDLPLTNFANPLSNLDSD